MCGIAGWFDVKNQRQPDRTLIQAMADAIAHRGPDGEGFHFEAGLALAHRRLAIIDLNTGQQPMFSEEKRLAIVFNGEIYNYKCVRRELKALGHEFRTSSDTEVILRSWVEWGENCVEHLNGMFAFALWDRQKQSLFLARDRLGEKPLYYAVLEDGSVVFGSELKALIVDSRVKRVIDPCAVQDFFSLGYVADPKTIYRDVKKLGAGHSVVFQRGGAARLRQYWDAIPLRFQGGNIGHTAEQLLDRLRVSVKSQLVADVPVGTFLSGGVDSSAVTALAATQMPEAIKSFTIGFDDQRYDERSYAQSVAKRYGVRQYSELASGDDFDSVRRLAGIFDEPFGDSSAMPTFHLARLASRTVKVALSGDGGDELFAGYRRYQFHGREEAVRQLLPESVRRPVFGFLSRVYPQFDWLPQLFRARHTFQELSKGTVQGYFDNVSVLDSSTRDKLFSDAFRKELGGYSSSEVISEHMTNAPTDDAIATAQYVDLKTWLVSDILTKVDRTAMACGLEVRVPMLDAEFVCWSLGLPRAMKMTWKQGKVVLKRALEPLLPPEVLYRRKQGFSVPLASWFCGAFGGEFERDLGASEELAHYINIDFVRELLLSHQKGWSDNSRALWLVWMFKGFLDQTHNRYVTRYPELRVAPSI